MNNDNQMWTWTLDMCIAAYMHRNPDTQVRTMAKRYKKLTNNKNTQRTLKTIIKSSRPSLVVKVTYDELRSPFDGGTNFRLDEISRISQESPCELIRDE